MVGIFGTDHNRRSAFDANKMESLEVIQLPRQVISMNGDYDPSPHSFSRSLTQSDVAEHAVGVEATGSSVIFE